MLRAELIQVRIVHIQRQVQGQKVDLSPFETGCDMAKSPSMIRPDLCSVASESIQYFLRK